MDQSRIAIQKDLMSDSVHAYEMLSKIAKNYSCGYIIWMLFKVLTMDVLLAVDYMFYKHNLIFILWNLSFLIVYGSEFPDLLEQVATLGR